MTINDSTKRGAAAALLVASGLALAACSGTTGLGPAVTVTVTYDRDGESVTETITFSQVACADDMLSSGSDEPDSFRAEVTGEGATVYTSWDYFFFTGDGDVTTGSTHTITAEGTVVEQDAQVMSESPIEYEATLTATVRCP